MTGPRDKLFSIIGPNAQGDIGPWTMYTNKRKQRVVFLKAPPKEPARPLQLIYRDRWRLIGIAWRRLNKETRAKWTAAANQARLRITGWNLYLYYQTRSDITTVATVERATGIQLLPTPTY